MVPAHVVLGRREERGVDVEPCNLIMDLTGLYPIAAEHAEVEACGSRFTCLAIVRFRFNT